jgi:hypothetical protein
VHVIDDQESEREMENSSRGEEPKLIRRSHRFNSGVIRLVLFFDTPAITSPDCRAERHGVNTRWAMAPKHHQNIENMR